MNRGTVMHFPVDAFRSCRENFGVTRARIELERSDLSGSITFANVTWKRKRKRCSRASRCSRCIDSRVSQGTKADKQASFDDYTWLAGQPHSFFCQLCSIKLYTFYNLWCGETLYPNEYRTPSGQKGKLQSPIRKMKRILFTCENQTASLDNSRNIREKLRKAGICNVHCVHKSDIPETQDLRDKSSSNRKCNRFKEHIACT